MKKIFAALAGALALIIVPPDGGAERHLPLVLDLSVAPRELAPPEVAPISIALVWPIPFQ